MGCRPWGVPGVPWHPQILADQLTLSQPGHCVFKWILGGHFNPPPNATILIMFEVISIRFEPISLTEHL